MQKRCSIRFNALALDSMGQKSNTRCSWCGTPLTVSVPNDSSPFSLHSSNGGEFINEGVIAYCAQEHLTFTRGRPYLKNDQCFVEQKNGAVVRQVVGYDRLVGEQAYRQLTELYRGRLYGRKAA